MEPRRNLLRFIIPLIVCIVTMSIFLICLGCHWMGPVIEKTSDYCEIEHNGMFKEPINTWSNLGFIIVGLTIAWQMMWGLFKDNANVLTRRNVMSIFFSSLVVCLAPGSMAMHASYTRVGAELDELSMYLICGFIFSYAMQRFFYLNVKYCILIFVVVIIICELTARTTFKIPIVGWLSNLTFGIFVTLTILTEVFIIFYRRTSIIIGWGIACLVTFIIAFVIWAISKNNEILCFPHSWFQGHAVWHLLDALALYFLFVYYVSEHNEDQSQLLTVSVGTLPYGNIA